MKSPLLIALTFPLFFAGNSIAQKPQVYDPTANATNDITMAASRAKAEKKFVLIQAGGNWCSWCLEFVRFAKATPSVDSVLSKNFIWYHLNYSKENKNPEAFARYGYPQRFGFPVFIIVDGEGNRIHTQNSAYLEDGGKSYDAKKVVEFLAMWSPDALQPEQYLEKQPAKAEKPIKN